MLFNSVDFAFFFLIVFTIYWSIHSKFPRVKMAFLLLSSYIFYASWHWNFIFLIAFSTLFNFYIAQLFSKNVWRKYVLWFGISVNVALLGFFKYNDFFTDNFASVFTVFGSGFNNSSLQFIIPIGISFYTFQNIGYIVDVYRRDFEASRDLLSFSVFVAFFPQLVSGPIPKANHLLPQFAKSLKFNYVLATKGLRLILLGLFEKMVIADNCAAIVETIYQTHEIHSGSTLFFAAILFSFQIYGDFSGYSHMAIGFAALLGFDLRKNFNYPYLAKNIADFWRRWHISFSIWLRDYIYIPLGGNKKGMFVQSINLAIVFLFTGLWHGATWNFVIYGLIHAVLFILYVHYRKWSKLSDRKSNLTFEGLTTILSIGGTFVVLTLARVFFNTPSVSQALSHLDIIFSASLFEKPEISRLLIVSLFGFLGLEWIQRNRDHLLDISFIKQRPVRYAIYLGTLLIILLFAGETQQFIYSQF